MLVLFNILCFFCLIQNITEAFYSIGYYDASTTSATKVKDLNLHFVNSPSSEQVADIYRRLVGLTPILQEDEATLPRISISSNTKEKPATEAVESEKFAQYGADILS